MIRKKINILLITGAVLLAQFASVTPGIAMEGSDILAAVDRNLNPDSYEMYRKLINIEPDGKKREYILYTLKKGRDRMAVLFLAPSSEKGRTTLRIGENMWLYIPAVGKPLRITSLQSVVGGVFNNSDILRLDYSSEYEVKEVTDTGEYYELELQAKSVTVAYDRLKMKVEKNSLLPTVIECYAISGMLIKTLRYSQTKDFGNGVVRPSALETDSPLYKGYKSVMIFGKIEEKILADEVFTLNFMSRIDSLR
jgi:hypothetical protein